MRFNRVIPWMISFLLASVLLTGCVNPYQMHYLSTIQNWPAAISQSVLPPPGPPQLVTSTDMKADAHTMLEDGFTLLGRSVFQHPKIDESQALDQAKAIGAWVVLVSNSYVGTKTKSIPMLNWTPPVTTYTTVNVQVQRNPYSQPMNIQRQITQTTPGQTDIEYVPVNVSYYKYAATFWAKTKPTPIGVLVSPLTAAQQQTYQMNTGLMVKVVIKGSPAFLANVLEGDILVSLAGENIVSPDQFYDLVSRNAGQTVSLNLIRNGQPLTLQIHLNPA